MGDEENRRVVHMQLMGHDTYLFNGIRVAIVENKINGGRGRVYVFGLVTKADSDKVSKRGQKNYDIGKGVVQVSYDSRESQGKQRIEMPEDCLLNIIVGCGHPNDLYLDQVSRRHDAAKRVIKLIEEELLDNGA